MAEESRAVSAAAHQRKNCSIKKDACVGVFFDSAAPAEAGGSPLCRTPAGGGESVHIFRGRKRVLVLGKVRADGALTQRVSAAGCCTAQSASVPCVRGRRWVFRPLRFTRRRVVAASPRRPHVHPPYGMVRRCQGAARGWYLNSPHRECLYHVLGSVCGHTQRGCAASLFICT